MAGLFNNFFFNKSCSTNWPLYMILAKVLKNIPIYTDTNIYITQTNYAVVFTLQYAWYFLWPKLCDSLFNSHTYTIASILPTSLLWAVCLIRCVLRVLYISWVSKICGVFLPHTQCSIPQAPDSPHPTQVTEDERLTTQYLKGPVCILCVHFAAWGRKGVFAYHVAVGILNKLECFSLVTES